MSHFSYGNRQHSWQSPFSHGLTLLELVVVLGILAVLSTVAIRSLEPIADQARYEQTQLLLSELRSAIVSPPYSTAGSTTTPRSSFAIDTGTLPVELDDLLTRPMGIIDRELQSFDSDRDTIDDIHLASGWNGPYISLGAGSTRMVDGWGREPTLIPSGGSLEILSMGSDGDSLPPEDGYRKDISAVISPQDYEGTVIFRVYAIDLLNGSRIDPSPIGNQRIAVLFYGVNATGGTSGEIAEQTLLIPNSGSFEYRRENTIVGTCAARAILWDDINGDQILDAGETILSKSIVVYPSIQPRVDTRVEMELR